MILGGGRELWGHLYFNTPCLDGNFLGHLQNNLQLQHRSRKKLHVLHTCKANESIVIMKCHVYITISVGTKYCLYNYRC